MKKEANLFKKIKGLLREIQCPRFLHHFGPKKYKFKQHALALLLKEVLKLSFRRVSKLLRLLGIIVPTYSALCKSRKRIPKWIWQKLLQLTSGIIHKRVAIDSTGFSMSNPSFYYIKRINRRKPVKSYVKLSALFDLNSKKFIALRARAKLRHDIKDAGYLLNQDSSMKKLIGDTSYDAEFLHERCFWSGIQTIIKPRVNVRRGFFRKKQLKKYSDEEYHQRSLIESGFGSIKRKYGGYTLAKRFRNIQAEIYCKAIAHNLSLMR